MTWLDWHIYKIGRVFEQRFGLQPDGVREGFTKVTQATLMSVPKDAGPETGQRFEVDLLPFVHPALLSLSSCLRPRPSLIDTLRATDLGALHDEQLTAHFAKIGFTYIDLPQGCVPIGEMFEIRGIFVRSAVMEKRDNAVAPAFSRESRLFDAIFGRSDGAATRQRLTWMPPGSKVVQARVPIDEDYPSEVTKPAQMLEAAGLSAHHVLKDLMQIALATIHYAQTRHGTPKAKQLLRLPQGDAALRDNAPDPHRSVLDVIELS